MLTNAYCSVADLSGASGIDDAADTAIEEACINAASRMIDRWTGRKHGFWQDTNVVVREFHADDNCTVLTDDISTTTGLIVKSDTSGDGTYASTLTITTDFMLYPLNSSDETPARPFDEIHIMPYSAYYFPTTGRPGVQVTAKWGWAAVPDEVKLACIFQAQMLYVNKDARGGIVQTGPDGFATFMSRYMHPQAQLLLADFRKEAR